MLFKAGLERDVTKISTSVIQTFATEVPNVKTTPLVVIPVLARSISAVCHRFLCRCIYCRHTMKFNCDVMLPIVLANDYMKGFVTLFRFIEL